MYWYDPIILYSIVIMIVHLTQTTTEKIPYQNEFVTNRTMKDRIFIDDFITLFNSEKKFLPLTSNDLSEDTSEYGTSSAIVNQHRSSDSNINDSTDDFDEFLGINTKEFDRELVEKAVTSDGSGETTDPTSETTAEFTTSDTTTSTTTTVLLTEIIPSGNLTFFVTLNCTDAYTVLMNIFNQLRQRLSYLQYFIYDNNTLGCPRVSNINVEFTILTNNTNVSTLTTVFQTLASITSTMEIPLTTVNVCGTSEPVTTIDSCYLIDRCNLCGVDPRRGVCLPEKNVSRCECFIDQRNPSISYTDEFCLNPIENLSDTSIALWIPIVIGILGGIVVLLCLTVAIYILIRCRRRSQKRQTSDQHDNQIGRFQCLSRAPIPLNTSPILTNNSSDPIDDLFSMIDHEDIHSEIYQ